MENFPHFIIAGAMKCGTSSLHHILSKHPDIYIPQREIHFFDMTDFHQHKDFFVYEEDKWWHPTFDKERYQYLEWYHSFFENAGEGQIIGEDSTTYLASKTAPKRIAELIPSVKIIIMLRDPTDRTYSHYWHLFKTGRATKSFEESIRDKRGTLITRSLYKKQIFNFTKHISHERIKFICFEDFIENMDRVVSDVLSFLGINSDKFSLRAIDTHQNKSTVPLSVRVQLFRNKFLQSRVNKLTYFDHLPFTTPPVKFSDKVIYKLIKKAHRLVNPPARKEVPPMKPETRKFLNSYFNYKNNGINEIAGFEIDKFWYK